MVRLRNEIDTEGYFALVHFFYFCEGEGRVNSIKNERTRAQEVNEDDYGEAECGLLDSINQINK